MVSRLVMAGTHRVDRPKPRKKLRRQPDPVTPELVAYLRKRDGGCVPHLYLGAPGFCMNRWGRNHSAYALGELTVEHVHDGPTGRMGKRAPSDKYHTLLACWGIGVQSWELSHKHLERQYLLDKEGTPPKE